MKSTELSFRSDAEFRIKMQHRFSVRGNLFTEPFVRSVFNSEVPGTVATEGCCWLFTVAGDGHLLPAETSCFFNKPQGCGINLSSNRGFRVFGFGLDDRKYVSGRSLHARGVTQNVSQDSRTLYRQMDEFTAGNALPS